MFKLTNYAYFICISLAQHVMMKSTCVFAVLVIIVVSLTSSCYGQIHYTPDWGHGKRSLATMFGDSGTDSALPCLEQTEMNLLLEVAKILTVRIPTINSYDFFFFLLFGPLLLYNRGG